MAYVHVQGIVCVSNACFSEPSRHRPMSYGGGRSAAAVGGQALMAVSPRHGKKTHAMMMNALPGIFAVRVLREGERERVVEHVSTWPRDAAADMGRPACSAN